MADKIPLTPHQIERKSFEIIAKHVKLEKFPAEARPIITRVVHATGDFQLARLLRFDPRAVRSGVRAIRSGGAIVTDVNMVKAGINRGLLRAHANKIYCAIHHADVAARAKQIKTTRAAVAMQKLRRRFHNGIVVIGNAPTALFAVLDFIKAGAQPALVVGVPVGFVGAAESKLALERSGAPYITVRGPRGGSSIAVAVINALLNRGVSR